MKTIRCKNYGRLLRAEYTRLQKNASSVSVKTTLQQMEKLLESIEGLKSPRKESAFVEGIMRLNQIGDIAA